MDGLRQAILGSGGRKTTILGICGVLGAVCVFLQGGELNFEALSLALVGLTGLMARDGGNGSDTA